MKDIKRSKGFTLIELIAVLVILAILALIVTPLVLNVVKKSKDSANKRSVDAYGKSVELAVASYLLDTGDFPTSIDDLTIEYSGKKVVCGVSKLNEDSSVYLSECKVGNSEVKDSSNEDGWYYYGAKESEYDYKIGDIITYKGMNFYVLSNSKRTDSTVTLLKAEPLSVDEVNTYGVGHVNRYAGSSVGTAYNWNNNGYGGMAYYSSETCGYVNGSWVETECTTDYAQSEVKHVVDAWAKEKFKVSDLSVDATGYSARLITYDELLNLGYDINKTSAGPGTGLLLTEDIPDWVYNSNYSYWTMNQFNDYTFCVWRVNDDGQLNYGGKGDLGVYNSILVVRPVVTLLKSAL